jgi:hypothetical protein
MARMAYRILPGGLYYPRLGTWDRLVQIRSPNVDAYIFDKYLAAVSDALAGIAPKSPPGKQGPSSVSY